MKTTLSFTDYDLRLLTNAISEAQEGKDGDWDDDDVALDALSERLRQARRRLRRRAA